MTIRWIFYSIIFIITSIYGFQAVKAVTKQSWVYYLYFGVTVAVIAYFLLQFAFNYDGKTITIQKSYALGFFMALISFNLVLIPFLFGEDIIRGVVSIFEKVTNKSDAFYLPSRRKFISQIALGLAAIPLSTLLYGIFQGKYNFRVLNYTLHFDDLPDAFDGYRITQISDIHSGSFDNKAKIEYAVDLINEQKSDVLLFTGDMVNNRASEMIPWKDTFERLKAKDGKFSILGNHDYGDYVDWNSAKEKHENLEELKGIQKEIGFDLLLNESRYLEKNGQRLALVGVENWGKGGFKKAGDLEKASSQIQSDDFKILMSHDPSHWEAKVLNDPYHYHLTLSGHTHGMQFGIEIPGWIKWSPAKYRYKQWAGIYTELGQHINVNRGFGYLGFPGRVGIWPEISVIELKKGAKEA